MGGGDPLPGFPHPHPTTSYWQLPPHSIASHRTTSALPLSDTFDYIILGSGLSGAAVAHKLLSRDPSLSILMLEARTAASGASGRNGGHCRAGFWLNFKTYVAAFGEDEAVAFEKLEEDNIRDLAEFVRAHDVDCDFREVETADAYVTDDEWADVLDVVRVRDEVRRRRPDSHPFTKRKVMHASEAREQFGMPTIVGAVTYPAHTLNPYRLTCRMLELSLEKGLNLQTNTPALEVVATQASGGPARWDVKTDRGTVRAKQVVLATNAYSNALHPGLAATGFLTHGRSTVAAIRPGKNMLRAPAFHRSVGMNDLGGSGDYFFTRAPGLQGEGDILYGGGKNESKTKDFNTTDDSTVDPAISDYLHNALARFYGREAWGETGEVVRDWSGIVCYTPDTFPLVGEAPGQKGLWMTVGMNGHGMAMAFRSAEALVEMMTTGKEPDWYPKVFRPERAWKNSTPN